MSELVLEQHARTSQLGLGIVLGLCVLVPAFAVIVMVAGLAPDPTLAMPEMHFYSVTLIALVAVGMAVFMAISATLLQDIRILLLSIAYLSSSIVLLTHAMTTPGVLVGGNPWVGVSGNLGVLLAAMFLALAGSNWTPSFQRRMLKRGPRILGIAATLLGGFFAFALLTAYDGSAGSFAFLTNERLVLVATLVTYALIWLAAFRFIQLYRRNPSPVILAVLASTVLFMETVITMTNTTLWQVSWWLHHLMLFFAFVVVVVGIVVQYQRRSTLRGVLEGLLLRDSIHQVEREYTEAIIALVAAVEARDRYTHGHSANVARISEQIGRQLGLMGETLEMLHLSALLHDIGKLSIPDRILLKPGPLSEAEFAVIKEHPVRGVEIASKIGSLCGCVPGIRSHHERLDGSGYPDGLCGDEIPLIARIIAVADCYDAMTSRRPYRGPRSPEQALKTIQSEAGTLLDARAVEALVAIILESTVEDSCPTKARLAAA